LTEPDIGDLRILLENGTGFINCTHYMTSLS
jgi:hypothetical protein